MELKILMLLAGHFLGDFVLQSDWMAINKSRSWSALSAHVIVYGCTMALFGGAVLATRPYFYVLVPRVGVFALITFLAHFSTDAVTSRITTALWKREQRHWFFVCIGLDQLLHAAQLILTLRFLQ